VKTKQIRAMLCETLRRVEKGEISGDAARSVIGLANQIQASLAVEVKVANLRMRAGQKVDDIGDLDVAA
jgi:hypothetical protein